jgi:hypothetical protein
MTVRVPVYDVKLRGTNMLQYPLEITDGSLTADEGWAPFMQGSIVVKRPDAALIALMDPTSPRTRVTLVLSASAPGGYSTSIDLKITAIQEDLGPDVIGMNLSSDETLLQQYGLVASAPDRTAWSYQSSVQSIIFYVMNKAIGPSNFSITYRPTNKTFLTYAPAENLIPNGSFDNGSVVPWSSNGVVMTASTGYKVSGTYSMLLNPNGTSNDTYAEVPISVKPLTTYTASAIIAALGQTGTLSARARRVWVYAVIEGQVTLLAQSNQAAPNAVGTRLSTTFTTPANIDTLIVRLYCGAPSGSTQAVYYDNVALFEGNGFDTNGVSSLFFFDGATADDASYLYDWTGDAYNSSSTRRPLIDRGPDTLTWTPGQTAWDFLTPILQAVGWKLTPLKMLRQWAVTENEAIAPGTSLSINYGQNLYDLKNLTSRTATQDDGTPLYADAVVIHYTWVDSTTGERREAWDSAGGGQKTHTVEYTDVAYPGPGAAAYLLERLQARKQQLTVTAAQDYSAWPGQEISISTGPSTRVTGYLDAVTWDLGTAEMSIKTKGLIIVPAGSIGRAPVTQTIGSVDTTVGTYTN